MARESDLGQSLGLGAQQWRCGTAGGGLCQRVYHEGRGAGGGGGGLVMSVQQGEVVGEVEFWPRPRPRVWLQKL